MRKFKQYTEQRDLQEAWSDKVTNQPPPTNRGVEGIKPAAASAPDPTRGGPSSPTQGGGQIENIVKAINDPETKRIIDVGVATLKRVPADGAMQSRRGFLKWGLGAAAGALGGGIVVYLLHIFGTRVGITWFKQQQQNAEEGREIEPPPPEIMKERPDPNEANRRAEEARRRAEMKEKRAVDRQNQPVGPGGKRPQREPEVRPGPIPRGGPTPRVDPPQRGRARFGN